MLENNNLTFIISVLTSVGFGMTVTAFTLRKKTKAETQLFQAEMYSTMLGDLRAQLDQQGSQIKTQASQILNLQQKENEYVKIIKNGQSRERGYINKIKELEKALKESQDMLIELQIKFQTIKQ